MTRHNCSFCDLYFYSKYRLSSHELFFHGKYISEQTTIGELRHLSWENQDMIMVEHRKLTNALKRQENRVKHIKETKKFRDKRNRRWAEYREVLQFELRKQDAMKRSLKLFEKEARAKGVEVG